MGKTPARFSETLVCPWPSQHEGDEPGPWACIVGGDSGGSSVPKMPGPGLCPCLGQGLLVLAGISPQLNLPALWDHAPV